MNQNRIFGLDVLRSIAILTVLYGHALHILPFGLAVTSPLVRGQFIDGVGIFFALSGFLIGTILLKKLQVESVTLKTLVSFWRDRWLRTLPAYFFILLVLMVATFRTIPLTHYLPYFFFVQNIHSGQLEMFTESWSLSVEEWFYLTIPVLFFIGVRLGKPKKVLPYLILSIIILGNLIRVYRGIIIHPTDFYQFAYLIMMTVPTRIDAIMFGVMGAYLSFYQYKIWTKQKTLLFVIGTAGFLANHFYYNLSGTYGFYTMYCYIPLQGLFSVLLIPKMASIKTGKGYLAKVLTFIAKTSYSIYLIHVSVFHLYVQRFLPNSWKIQLPFYLLFAFGGGYLLYSTVEEAGRRWRDKLKSQKKKVRNFSIVQNKVEA